MARWFGFFLAILLGIAAGLYYGWVLNPVEYVDTTPDTLRLDYQTDTVLMVAEIYQANRDVELAIRQLAFLGDAGPTAMVQTAYEYAAQTGYGQSDLNLILALRDALQNWNPAGGSAP